MKRVRVLIGAVFGAAVFVVGATAAGADSPAHVSREFALVVQDEGENCGFSIRWEINGTVNEQRFFDQEGTLIRLQAHIQESNVLTNLATGKTVADEPVFNQVAIVNPDGTLQSVETMGLFVNVRGEPGTTVMDVGLVSLIVISPTKRELIFEAGQHPFRAETKDLVSLRDGLSAFCDVLA
jgi:hypothetical protein